MVTKYMERKLRYDQMNFDGIGKLAKNRPGLRN